MSKEIALNGGFLKELKDELYYKIRGELSQKALDSVYKKWWGSLNTDYDSAQDFKKAVKSLESTGKLAELSKPENYMVDARKWFQDNFSQFSEYIDKGIKEFGCSNISSFEQVADLGLSYLFSEVLLMITDAVVNLSDKTIEEMVY